MPNPTSKLNLVIDGVTTQLDIHDANAVDLTSNQTVGGVKTFSNGDKTFTDSAPLRIQGCNKGNEFSNNARTVLELRSNRDTENKSCIYITKFRQNRAQGSMGNNDNVILTMDVLENEVRTNDLLRFTAHNWINDAPTEIYLEPATKVSNIQSFLGSSTRPWEDTTTNAINGLNPSSLGMPDLDNGIDISGYITVVANANKESLYTPPANGWISVALTRTGGSIMAVMLKQGNFVSSGHNIAQENETTTCNAMLPVKGGVQVSINSALADRIAFAYFYPCQGNV